MANRVAEIHDQSSPAQWRHVDTAQNPADDVSRGMSADDIIKSERWLHGPRFLCESEDCWPKQPIAEELELDTVAEVKKETKIYHVQQKTLPLDSLCARYSSWTRLKRAVAWLLRLKDHLHKKTLKTTKADT